MDAPEEYNGQLFDDGTEVEEITRRRCASPNLIYW